MIGMLIADDRSFERFLHGLGAVGPHRQRTNAVIERELVGRIQLNARRNHARIVEGGDRQLSRMAIRLESQRQIDSGKVESLIAARNDARKSKNFKESDRIRDELAAMGVVIKDSKDGTSWEIAR